MSKSTYRKSEAWNDWWKQKQKSNDDFMAAAEFGDL